jgi:hypothetical protein
METSGPISPAEASAALAAAARSRTRVAWAGYPTWYWLAAGAGLAALPFATVAPDWLGLLGVALVAGLLVTLAFAAGRVRGVCEGVTRSAMRWGEGLLLYGPALVVLLAGAFVPWSPIVTGALVFALFVGAGLTLSARAARR